MRTLTPSEFNRAHDHPDDTAMLMVSLSRYEDAGSRRAYLDPDLPEPTIVMSRKKVRSLHVPSVDDLTADVVHAYVPGWQRLFVRPPFILPESKAPWTLTPGESYRLASGQMSTAFPDKPTRSTVGAWLVENADRPGFMPCDIKPGEVTDSDMAELNVRLWDDARGVGPARRNEIRALVTRYLLRNEGLGGLEPYLPESRHHLEDGPEVVTPGDGVLTWPRHEESVWAAIIGDPDVFLFAPDVDQSVDFYATKNLFLEADNLLALKVLRLTGYERKVKLTYIDPPYNTGNEFIYNDKFKGTEFTGSPFTGRRWQEGTWRILQRVPAVLAPVIEAAS